MAGKGGKRPGAGRPKGGTNERTRQARVVADRAIKAPVTPLDVMLEAMAKAHAAGDLSAAHAFAKDAAPYVHPKLAAIEHEHTGKDGGPIQMNITDADRAKALAAFVARTKAKG